jgi:hypothetical protein
MSIILANMDYKNDPLIDSLNKRNEKELIYVAVSAGLIIGFLIGIVVSSLLHKFIVHPLGW